MTAGSVCAALSQARGVVCADAGEVLHLLRNGNSLQWTASGKATL